MPRPSKAKRSFVHFVCDDENEFVLVLLLCNIHVDRTVIELSN